MKNPGRFCYFKSLIKLYKRSFSFARNDPENTRTLKSSGILIVSITDFGRFQRGNCGNKNTRVRKHFVLIKNYANFC